MGERVRSHKSSSVCIKQELLDTCQRSLNFSSETRTHILLQYGVCVCVSEREREREREKKRERERRRERERDRDRDRKRQKETERETERDRERERERERERAQDLWEGPSVEGRWSSIARHHASR